MNSTDTKSKSRAEREAEEKAARRAEAATIVAGLKQALDGDEQLLGFARGRLAGGIRGKMSLGPEAFFAPYVNIGLTERRLVIQHINAETGRPGEILPHYYALGDIATMTFSDIETFGGEAAARLTLRLRNEQHTRLRLRGQTNFENAQAIVEVFRSLTLAQRPGTTPTQRVCATCQHIMDQPFKFCPYCGQQQDPAATTSAPPAAAEAPERSYPPTPPGPTEPEFLDAVPYQDASAFRGPTVEDGLEFLTPVPASVPEPTIVPEPAVDAEPSPSPVPAPAPEPEASTVIVQDSAAETPSTFEGWSVEPEAEPASAQPAAVAEEAVQTAQNVSEHAAVERYEVDTEASVAESTQEAAFVAGEPVDNAAPVATVSPAPETESAAPIVHPEAEFTTVPEPAASALEPAAFAAMTESFSEAAPQPMQDHSAAVLPEHIDVPPAQESAGFVTIPVASESPTPVVQDFEAFAPVSPTFEAPAFLSPPEVPEPTPAPPVPAAASPEMPKPVTPPQALAEPIQETPVAFSPSEDRFAALLKEIRGSDAPSEPTTPQAAPERKDGPMSVQIHVNRPLIKVNETLAGRNADEVVGKLKERVVRELNFAQRLMVNSLNNLRFAQEIVRRYNAAEKTNYPVPNSCWEFLESAEKMGFATIRFNS